MSEELFELPQALEAGVLYETDFFLWTKQQAALLQEGAVKELDIPNLVEEIESLGRSHRHQLENRLAVLVRHLLKWCYHSPHRPPSRSWRSTIIEQRRRIRKVLAGSPSLRQHVAPTLIEDYPSIREQTLVETGLPETWFPDTCPWTAEQVMDDAFWPEERSPDDGT